MHRIEDFTPSCSHEWLLLGKVTDLLSASIHVSRSAVAPSTGSMLVCSKELWVTPLQSLLMYSTFISLSLSEKHI